MNLKKHKKALFIILLLTVCLALGKLLFINRKSLVSYYAYYIVSSASMSPIYPLNSIVIIEKCSFNKLELGDVIIFRSHALNGQLALHRIVRFSDNGIYTKGDSNNFEDNQKITSSEYVGKAVGKLPYLGCYFSRIQTLGGLIVYLIIPLYTILFSCFLLKKVFAKDHIDEEEDEVTITNLL